MYIIVNSIYAYDYSMPYRYSFTVVIWRDGCLRLAWEPGFDWESRKQFSPLPVACIVNYRKRKLCQLYLTLSIMGACAVCVHQNYTIILY